MPLFDLPLEELREYRPVVRTPPDFDRFWSGGLRTARTDPQGVTVEEVHNGLALVDTYDVSFNGFGGHAIRAWLHVPAGATRPLPVVVEYPGYGGGRGLRYQNTIYAVAGYAHFVVDVRAQGQWMTGDTPDPEPGSGSGSVVGFMTRGIQAPEDYYYRRVIIDAVRAVDAVRQVSFIDPDRVVVAGASQGGGIALAVSGLVEGLRASLIDIPFLCNFERAIELSDRDPYAEVGAYLARYRDREVQVLNTLSYFDGVTFAARAGAPALFSVALMDRTCPPSTVFAAFNAYAGEKQIAIYKYNDHEGGAEHHLALKLNWAASVLQA